MQQDLQQWRDITDYEGLYQVSNDGQVRRLVRLLDEAHFEGIRKPLRVLKPGRNMQGRLQVTLCKNNVPRRFQIHALVLEAFKGERPEGAEARHLDGDYLNNRVDNLEWRTRTKKDKATHGTQARGEEHLVAKLTANQVREIRALDLSERRIAQMFGISNVTVHLIKKRKIWAHIPQGVSPCQT